MQKNIGNDFSDFSDQQKIALQRRKDFWQSRKIVKYAEKIVKNAWHYARACVSLYQNSDGDWARPEIARKGTKRRLEWYNILKEFLDEPSVSPNGHAERKTFGLGQYHCFRKTNVHERSELTSMSNAN